MASLLCHMLSCCCLLALVVSGSDSYFRECGENPMKNVHRMAGGSGKSLMMMLSKLRTADENAFETLSQQMRGYASCISRVDTSYFRKRSSSSLRSSFFSTSLPTTTFVATAESAPRVRCRSTGRFSREMPRNEVTGPQEGGRLRDVERSNYDGEGVTDTSLLRAACFVLMTSKRVEADEAQTVCERYRLCQNLFPTPPVNE